MAKQTFVVDDEKAISDSLAAILNHHGFLASAFYSPQSALAERGHKIVPFSGQAATAAMLERARARGYHFELPAKPVHPKQLLARLAASKLHQPPQVGAYIHNSVGRRHMPPMQSRAIQ